MSEAEFVEFATVQIAVIDRALARHRPAGGHCCSCGQTLPCPPAETLRLRRRHYAGCIETARATAYGARPAENGR
ncbi:hypothetical protein [Pilimelia terevasa]|nr:hypothetical protein [Pilimelia terevasa]